MNCGTDFFSPHIYYKLRRRLEMMDPNNSYRYRREYELFPCRCYEGELEAPAQQEEEVEEDLEAQFEALLEEMVIDTL